MGFYAILDRTDRIVERDDRKALGGERSRIGKGPRDEN